MLKNQSNLKKICYQVCCLENKKKNLNNFYCKLNEKKNTDNGFAYLRKNLSEQISMPKLMPPG